MQEYLPFIQNNLIWVIAWFGLLIALVFTVIKQKTARYRIITPADATLLINRQDAVLVDIRSRDDFRTGHIAGSVNIAAKDLKEGNYSNIEKHQSDPIILVCKTGQTSLDSANQLVKAGFEKINVLQNGLISWNEAKLPLVSGKKKK